MFTYKPKLIGSLYLALVPVFGVIYWLNPEFWKEPLSFIQSIYFSVVTITTLGYGDITPITEIARSLTALQSLMGIILIGLFLNSVAHTRVKEEEGERHKIVQEHLQSQYEEFRENIAGICLIAEAGGPNIDRDLAKRMIKLEQFREYFNENNSKRWYAVANGLESDSSRIEDIFIEIDLFSQQLTYALYNTNAKDKEALRILTRFSQHTYMLRNSETFSHEPVKHILKFLWSFMAGWNNVEGYRDFDVVSDAIQKL